MFIFVNPFIRHYVPFIKNKSEDAVKNVRFLYNKIYSIIMRCKKEIENALFDEPLRHDMLTSTIYSEYTT